MGTVAGGRGSRGRGQVEGGQMADDTTVEEHFEFFFFGVGGLAGGGTRDFVHREIRGRVAGIQIFVGTSGRTMDIQNMRADGEW